MVEIVTELGKERVISEEQERDALLLEIGGYEGPLDMLLDLARRQKVDLKEISMLELAEQYLEFIGRAERLEVELAADYLVMAVWLAFLKSCLLLPREDEEHISADEMAALLAARMERLEAMREHGEKLLALPRLGRNVFARGMPEPATVHRHNRWQAGLVDLLTAYTRIRARDSYAPLHLKRPPVVPVEEALDRWREIMPALTQWSVFTRFLPKKWLSRPMVRSALGSMFTSALEMTRVGNLELQQDRAFAPLHVRRRLAAVQSGDSGLPTPDIDVAIAA